MKQIQYIIQFSVIWYNYYRTFGQAHCVVFLVKTQALSALHQWKFENDAFFLQLGLNTILNWTENGAAWKYSSSEVNFI